jgi:hypothetical protein
MRPILTTILAASAALGGACVTPALAQDGQPHVMLVRLPDGSVRQIQYMGDVPPRVVFVPAPMAGAPLFAADGPDSPFAAMQRMSAIMDRQAEMMMRQVAAMQAAAADAPTDEPSGIAADANPAGARVYSMSSVIGAGGVCMRSVQITWNGDAKPQLVSHSSGDCGPAGAPANGAVNPGEVNAPRLAPAAPAARTIEVKAGQTGPDGARPALAMIEPTALDR